MYHEHQTHTKTLINPYTHKIRNTTHCTLYIVHVFHISIKFTDNNFPLTVHSSRFHVFPGSGSTFTVPSIKYRA